MKTDFKNLYRVLCNALMIIIATIPYVWIWFAHLNSMLFKGFLFKGNIVMILFYAIFSAVIISIFGGFKIETSKQSNILLSQFIGLFCVNICEIFITMLMVGYLSYVPRIAYYFLLAFGIQIVSLFVFTILTMVLYRKIFPPYKVLHIHGYRSNLLRNKMIKRWDTYSIEKDICYDEALENIDELIKSYDIILINDIPSEKRNLIVKACFIKSKKVYFTPKLSDIIVKGTDNLHVFDTPLFYCDNKVISFAEEFVKRIGDIFISLILIILTSPIMIFTSIAIFAYDRGPVFYRQKRLTRNGKTFKILKFRSMIVDAEKDGKARLAADNDSRITPVGKFIRACRIDELPQFFNILGGSMSIVGPRPERPEIAEEYYKELPQFVYRLKVKAGLTGYAQIYGKYNTTSYDKLKLDMLYVENCSILLDIKMILLTLKVVFQKESTEGLKEGKTIATNRNH